MKVDAFLCRPTNIEDGKTSWRPYHPELHFKNWRLGAGRIVGLSFHWLGWCASLDLLFASTEVDAPK